MTADSAIARWHQALSDASVQFGRPLHSVEAELAALGEAGFVDITQRRYAWPIGSWPRDRKLKEIGRWHALNMDMGLEALSLALLTRVMGWTQAEVLALCAEVRKDIRNPKIHAYWNMYV